MYNYLLHIRTWLIIKRKHLLDILPFSKSKNFIPFVILCEPRSGSTLLHTYLNFHPQILSYGEILREHREQRNSFKINHDILQAKVFNRHSKSLKSIGLKLFYEYYDNPLYTDVFNSVIKQKDVRVIHLIRKDIRRLYISLKIAEQTNVWSTSTTSDKKREKIIIDVEDYARFFNAYIENQKRFINLFKNHSTLCITYEDLSTQPDRILVDVQNFIGVTPRKLSTLLKKQNPESLASLIQNLEEIEAINRSLNLGS